MTFFPDANSTKAHGVSPHFSSGFATTATKDTAECFATTFSTSTDEIFSPPDIIMSFDLSLIWIYPSGYTTA